MNSGARLLHVRSVPEAIKQVVTVIYRRGGSGESPRPVGTGFVIRYPSQTRPNGGYQLIVTARHVATGPNGSVHSDLQIRVNRRGGGTEFLNLVPDESDSIVFVHPDPLVDLCVQPAGFDASQIEFKALSAEFFAPPMMLKPPQLREGVDVVFLGLFLPHPGETRNQPIVRFGRVALVSTEPILWDKHLLNLIVIEAQCFPGNSGAPVFGFLGDSGSPSLLGVLKGSFTQRAVKLEEFWLESIVGAAAVVPAYLLEEMLQEHVIPTLDRTMGEP